MDFIAKHALGPFKFCEYDNASVADRYGVLICECCGSDTSSGEDNARFFAQASAMIEYMKDRARMMSIYGFSAVENSELKRILTILKDAGVEVVEK